MMVVDSIAQRFNVPWSEKSSWKAEVATAHTSITTRHRVTPPPSTSGAKTSVRPTTADTVSDTTTGGGMEASTSTSTPTTTAAPVVKKKEPWVTSTLELTITLLKPLQLMNVSGTSVSKAGTFHLQPSSIKLLGGLIAQEKANNNSPFLSKLLNQHSQRSRNPRIRHPSHSRRHGTRHRETFLQIRRFCQRTQRDQILCESTWYCTFPSVEGWYWTSSSVGSVAKGRGGVCDGKV